MDDRTFNMRLRELEHAIGMPPMADREWLREMAAETRCRHEEIKEALRRRGELFDSLSLALKYLLFDLEATKRENALMRMRLSRMQDGGGPARPRD